MVELGETKVKSKGAEDNKVFKFKKNNLGRNNNSMKRADRDVPELLEGVELLMAKNGLDLYLKALENLQPYTLTTYKNGVDIRKFLKQEKLATFTPPELDENAMATQREMWKICANNTIK